MLGRLLKGTDRASCTDTGDIAVAYIYSNDRLMEKYYGLLWEGDPRNTVYLYGMDGDEILKPYLDKTPPFDGFEDYILDHFGDGHFFVMIRRGKKMLLSGEIGLLLPPNDPRKGKAHDRVHRYGLRPTVKK